MSDTPQGQGWWQASDGKWYPPEQRPGPVTPPAAPPPAGPPPATPPSMGPPPGPSPQVPGPVPGAGAGGGDKSATPSEAFNYGWLKFQQNIGDILIIVVIAVVGLILVTVAFWFLSGLLWSAVAKSDSVGCHTDAFGTTRCSGGGTVAGLFFVQLFVSILIFYFLYFLVQMVLIRGGLMITYGEKLDAKKMMSTENIGTFALGALLVALGTTVLCCFGFVFFFFAQFFGFFILDKQTSAMEGIRRSFQLVNKNLGTLIGFTIGVYIATWIGAALCGLGLIVAIPVVTIASAFMYRRLQGEPVAAA